MGKSEILAELPRLTAQERAEILDHLVKLDESSGPSEYEKAVLNEAQAAHDAAPDSGAPWTEVVARIRRTP